LIEIARKKIEESILQPDQRKPQDLRTLKSWHSQLTKKANKDLH